jgi:hypothetical protein
MTTADVVRPAITSSRTHVLGYRAMATAAADASLLIFMVMYSYVVKEHSGGGLKKFQARVGH